MLNFQHNGPNSYGAWYRDTWYVVEKADDGDWIFASMPRHGGSLQVISRHIGKSEAMGAAHAQSTADSRRKSARSKASRSKPKRAGAKRRTVTRLRRVRVGTGRRKGFGVMKHAVPTRYRGVHGYSVAGVYRNDATGLKARLVEIVPQGASPARYVIQWLDGPRKGEEQEVSERRMAGTFTGPV